MKFTYRSGHRPLDGYTLKRGVGQGGFGEVYFAISDGGKEVALKLLRGHSEIELRGVSNCLNMKHPNLVHVYDLKEDSLGNKWLIMEYVLGESLAAVLNRNPNGLPVNLIQEWFSNLAKAIAYLHDRGVVHRDIKPANIFIEAGLLKVGDYGLCKTMGTEQKHTRTIGTVHYMAPEISTGNYSQSIDIYACGIVLQEMLTGKLPFDGESDGEILMKHLTSTPDLTGVPVAFQPIVSKALDKNPSRRFSSMVEMAKAVDDACRQMMGTPAVIPVAQPPLPVATPLPQPSIPVAKTVPGLQSPEILPPPIPQPVAAPKPVITEPAIDLPIAKPVTPMGPRARLATMISGLLLSVPITAIGLIPYALISNNHDWATLAKFFCVALGLCWSFILGSGLPEYSSADNWGRRLRFGFLGMLIGVVAYWADGWPMPVFGWNQHVSKGHSYLFGLMSMPADAFNHAVRYMLFFGGVLLCGRWWKMTARDRKERLSLFPVIAGGVWCGVLVFLWPWDVGSPTAAFVPMVLSIVTTQLVSPWNPTYRIPHARKLRLRSA